MSYTFISNSDRKNQLTQVYNYLVEQEKLESVAFTRQATLAEKMKSLLGEFAEIYGPYVSPDSSLVEKKIDGI